MFYVWVFPKIWHMNIWTGLECNNAKTPLGYAGLHVTSKFYHCIYGVVPIRPKQNAVVIKALDIFTTVNAKSSQVQTGVGRAAERAAHRHRQQEGQHRHHETFSTQRRRHSRMPPAPFLLNGVAIQESLQRASCHRAHRFRSMYLG